MIVCDTNLLTYLLVNGINTIAAECVRAQERIWLAPPLLRYELLSVLNKHVQGGLLLRDEAIRIAKRGLDMVELSLLRPESADVFNLCERSSCSTYDIEFVWLAMQADVSLVTYDAQVLAAFPDVAIHPDRFK